MGFRTGWTVWVLALALVTALLVAPAVASLWAQALALSPSLARTVVADEPATEEKSAVEESMETRLSTAVRTWLADPACPADLAHRTDADIRFTALGPGRHGWRVQLAETGRIIGHMIVSATPEGGFQLVACGSGDVPPDVP